MIIPVLIFIYYCLIMLNASYCLLLCWHNLPRPTTGPCSPDCTQHQWLVLTLPHKFTKLCMTFEHVIIQCRSMAYGNNTFCDFALRWHFIRSGKPIQIFIVHDIHNEAQWPPRLTLVVCCLPVYCLG